MKNLYEHTRHHDPDSPFGRHLEKRLSEDWETNPRDFYFTDRPNSGKILDKIHHNMTTEKKNGRLLFYKGFSIAASILIVILSGLAIYGLNPSNREPVIYHSLNTGLRNLEEVTLPDGSVVKLGSGSKLTYPEDFNSGKREVWLSGQAFFDIVPSDKHEFIIHTSRTDITVLGTSFEVFAFEDFPEEIIALQGKIRVDLGPVIDPAKRRHYLTANQKMVISPDRKSYYIESVDAERYLAWRDMSGLSFEKEDLNMIVPRLEKWYGINIAYDPVFASRHIFTFKVRDEMPETIFRLMEEVSSLKVEKNEPGYKIIYK